MSYLFNMIYLTAMVVISPWILWRIMVQKKNRTGWGQKFFGRCPVRSSNRDCLWFHAVSVGEVKLLVPIIDRIKRQLPEVDIAISSTTETGMALAEKTFPDEITFFCPADFSWAVKTTLRRLRPTGLVLAELELWPNLIRLTAARKIPVSVINGRLSAKSARGYRKFQFLLKPIFKALSWVGAQSSDYAKRFVANGCEPSSVTVTGSIKFDGVETDRDHPETQRLKQVAQRAGIHSNHFVFMAGSTQPEEDVLAIQAYVEQFKKHPELRLILVPRHPSRSPSLCEQLESMDVPYVRRSSLNGDDTAGGRSRHLPHDDSLGDQATADRVTTDQAIVENAVAPVLIVDVIGELSYWWGVADAGYVGGSMGSRGGQSMIEPAGFGVPICFGPNTENFEDTVSQLLESEAAEVVSDLKQLTAFMGWCQEMPHLAQALGQRSQEVIGRNRGAADWTVDGIIDLMFDRDRPSCHSNKAA